MNDGTQEQTRIKRVLFIGTGFQESEVLDIPLLLHETLDTTRCIHDLLLSGVERMRCTGDVQFLQRIFVAIFPNDRVTALYCGPSQDGKVSGWVLEDHKGIFWIDAFFHSSPLFDFTVKGVATKRLVCPSSVPPDPRCSSCSFASCIAHSGNARLFLFGALKSDHLTTLVFLLRHNDLFTTG